MKKKTSLGIILCCFVVVGLGIGAYVYFQEYLILKQSTMVIEYGQTTTLALENFLDFHNLSEERQNDILKSTIVNTTLKNESDKDYPAVGEYVISFEYGREKKEMNVSVKDTVKPTIMKPKHIQVLSEEELDEKQLRSYFKVWDLAGVDVSFDLSQYDTKKIGEQTIQVIAKDQNGNETKEDVLIETIEKPDLNRYKVETIVDKDEEGNVLEVNVKMTEKKVILDVKVYSHHSVGASRGCDPAALYQAMKYKGYCQNIGLRAFIDDMPRSTSNPYRGFAGNPNGPDDPDVLEAIFPSAMVPWAKKYGNVVDFSGHSVDDIIEEVRKGNPVMVYITYDFKTPKWRQWSFGKMYSNLHCLTISGYNSETNQIRYTDAGGKRTSSWVSLSTFKKSYNYKKFAIVVR